MGKPFKDKLKNVGDFISGTIAEVEKQAKDSEVLEKISKGTKDISLIRLEVRAVRLLQMRNIKNRAG